MGSPDINYIYIYTVHICTNFERGHAYNKRQKALFVAKLSSIRVEAFHRVAYPPALELLQNCDGAWATRHCLHDHRKTEGTRYEVCQSVVTPCHLSVLASPLWPWEPNALRWVSAISVWGGVWSVNFDIETPADEEAKVKESLMQLKNSETFASKLKEDWRNFRSITKS